LLKRHLPLRFATLEKSASADLALRYAGRCQILEVLNDRLLSLFAGVSGRIDKR